MGFVWGFDIHNDFVHILSFCNLNFPSQIWKRPMNISSRRLWEPLWQTGCVTLPGRWGFVLMALKSMGNHASWLQSKS